MDRRTFLTATAAALALPGSARARVQPSERRFLLVFAQGGWDTTRVLSPMFHTSRVDVEAAAEPWSVGGLSLVDHPDRPSVRAFFEAWADRVALVHGLLLPSVAHVPCTEIALTGGTRGQADWLTRLAAADPDRYVLPHLVMGAPSFPAEHGQVVARAGARGQLDGVISGSLVSASGGRLVSPDLEALVDRTVEQRASSLAAGARPRDGALLAAFDQATLRAHDLKAARDVMRFAGDGTLISKLDVAVDALSSGMSRVVSVGFPDLASGWDSHADNDPTQGALWEELGGGLLHLVDRLASTAGEAGGTLLDEITVVVLSEMGRAPLKNVAAGKDHWPYTSAMLLGSGVRGGVTVGGYDDDLRGLPLDGGAQPSAADLGATLMTLGGGESEGSPLGALLTSA